MKRAPQLNDRSRAGASRSINVVSTMRFDADWLSEVASATQGVELLQHPAERIDDLPPDVLARAEVLYTGSCFPDRSQAPKLRWVQLDTSGADHVVGTDLWTNDKVTITSIGGVSLRPIAGYVMLMILGFAHRLPTIVDHQRRREWPTLEARWERFLPRHLDGSTMVVIGYGRLGQAVGRCRHDPARHGEVVCEHCLDVAFP